MNNPYYHDEKYGITIYHGDCRDILPELEPVDLVLTDPPYLKEFLWSYSVLSEYGAKLLPEGGYCFAYGAVEHIRESLSRMSECLEFFWIHVLMHNGGYPRMWDKHILSGYKPIFVYTKGKPTEKPWIASVHSDTMDKAFHTWGQGGGFSKKIIEMYTKQGQTILEPFLGGGTVLRAAKDLGRKAIGIEIEEKYCEIAVRRLQQDCFQWAKEKNLTSNWEGGDFARLGETDIHKAI